MGQAGTRRGIGGGFQAHGLTELGGLGGAGSEGGGDGGDVGCSLTQAGCPAQAVTPVPHPGET